MTTYIRQEVKNKKVGVGPGGGLVSVGKKKGQKYGKVHSGFEKEEKRWTAGGMHHRRKENGVPAPCIFFFFFFRFFCCCGVCGRFKSQLCYLNFFWVPGKATQNLWNECNGRIVWEPPIPSVVTFFSVLTLRARVGGGEGHGQESGENADASFLISLSVCLFKFLQCGLNP